MVTFASMEHPTAEQQPGDTAPEEIELKLHFLYEGVKPIPLVSYTYATVRGLKNIICQKDGVRLRCSRRGADCLSSLAAVIQCLRV